MVSLTINQLSDLNPLFNFFAWWFLPGYVSSLALTLFYRLRPSYRPPPLPPQPTGPNKKPVFDPIYEMSKLAHLEQAKRHQTVAHASVILVYLIYTVLSTYHQQSGSNYYSTLGLKSNSIAFNLPLPGTPPKVNVKKPQVVPDGLLDESGLKSHWRKLAKAFHPDKINPPSDLGSEQEIDEWKNEIESKFIEMREAYETLSDGTKQWAYNRLVTGLFRVVDARYVLMYALLCLGLDQPSPLGKIASLSGNIFWKVSSSQRHSMPLPSLRSP